MMIEQKRKAMIDRTEKEGKRNNIPCHVTRTTKGRLYDQESASGTIRSRLTKYY